MGYFYILNRRPGLTLCLALITLAFIASHTWAADDAKKIRLAYAGWEIGTAVAYVGVDSGLFKKNGLDIEEIPIRDNLSSVVQSLIGSDVLIGFGNPLAALQPMAGGVGVTVVGSAVHYVRFCVAV